MTRADETRQTLPDPVERLSTEELDRHVPITREAFERALEQGRRDREALESTQRHEFVDPRIRFL